VRYKSVTVVSFFGFYMTSVSKITKWRTTFLVGSFKLITYIFLVVHYYSFKIVKGGSLILNLSCGRLKHTFLLFLNLLERVVLKTSSINLIKNHYISTLNCKQYQQGTLSLGNNSLQ